MADYRRFSKINTWLLAKPRGATYGEYGAFLCWLYDAKHRSIEWQKHLVNLAQRAKD